MKVVLAGLGLILAVLVSLLFVHLRGPGSICYARNQMSRETLNSVVQALEVYRAKYGDYPGAGDIPLVQDTKQLMAMLGPLYGTSSDRDDKGQLLSAHGKPFYYTCPSNGVAPDGNRYPTLRYYIWTWGCVEKEPRCKWEINNWTASSPVGSENSAEGRK